MTRFWMLFLERFLCYESFSYNFHVFWKELVRSLANFSHRNKLKRRRLIKYCLGLLESVLWGRSQYVWENLQDIERQTKVKTGHKQREEGKLQRLESCRERKLWDEWWITILFDHVRYQKGNVKYIIFSREVCIFNSWSLGYYYI